MIEVKHLYKSFEEKEVLHGISASFYKGKVNLIIGQSGSGKTVLMKSLIGLLHPERGEILYDKRNLLAMSQKELRALRSEIGMLFQGSALFDSQTVLENVMFPIMMYERVSSRERKKRAEFCLERVNIQGANNLFPSEISGGMQKRVAIARAIALNPHYLFCDEPNSGLDPKTSLLIDDLIQDITKEYNMTTVVNTHDMNSVMGIGENIIFIDKGRKGWEGTKEEIFTADSPALDHFVFASDLFKKVKAYELYQRAQPTTLE